MSDEQHITKEKFKSSRRKKSLRARKRRKLTKSVVKTKLVKELREAEDSFEATNRHHHLESRDSNA